MRSGGFEASAGLRARARFQSGLLAWLRRPDDAAGLREMVAVAREAAATSDIAASPVLWRSAESFLSSLLDGSLPADDEARRLCRRIERHLAAAQGASVDQHNDRALCAALFAFVSRKNHPPAGEGGEIAQLAQTVSGLNRLGATLGVTAELLPLFAGAQPPRYSDEQVGRWRAAARHLDDAWHRLPREGVAPCRQAATALLAVALELGDAACLRLAEALATGIGCAEDPAFRDEANLRAAMAAALELAAEREGPNLAAFDRRSRALAERMATTEEALRAAANANRVDARNQAFVRAARSHLAAARQAQTAADAAALATAIAWFAEDHGCGNVLALRGLAVLAGQRQAALPPAVAAAAQALVVRALETAVEDLAHGRPPRPDEAAFAALRSGG